MKPYYFESFFEANRKIHRFCAENEEEVNEECKRENLDIISCDACTTDGCNGVPLKNGAAQFSPIALLAAVSVVITRIFVY